MCQYLVARLHHVRSFVHAVYVIRFRPCLSVSDPAYIDDFDDCSGVNIAFIVASLPIFCSNGLSLELD